MWTCLRLYGAPPPRACAFPTTLDFSAVALVTETQSLQCVGNMTRHKQAYAARTFLSMFLLAHVTDHIILEKERHYGPSYPWPRNRQF